MEAASETIEPCPEAAASASLDPERTPALPLHPRRAAARRWSLPSTSVATRGVALAVVVYLAALGLLFLVAAVNGALRHHSFASELVNWDGGWYRGIAEKGYPTHVSHLPSRLGFFPLYSMLMWLLAQLLGGSALAAGIVISAVGGLVATVLVQRLAAGWWGEQSARRAAVLFCLFPGAVVFSMEYSEGLLLALAAGCILALERRRWLLGGVLAAFATAVEPDALALIPVCAVAAFLELRRSGWGERSARRSLLAPLLSPLGASAFAIFLWARTGTPFATYQAQHYAWHERTDPLALVHLAERLARQISFTHFNHPTINLNLVAGMLGAVILFTGVVLLLRRPREISAEAITWTLATTFLAVTSEYVPPNPRILLTAFPAVLVFAHHLRGRAYAVLLVANGVSLVALSALTYVGTTLRP
jgi:Mannosyltransferase (PIG-V)